MTYCKYDICIAKVKFEDIDELKIRPILILDDKSLIVECYKITTKERQGECKIIQWSKAGLKKNL